MGPAQARPRRRDARCAATRPALGGAVTARPPGEGRRRSAARAVRRHRPRRRRRPRGSRPRRHRRDRGTARARPRHRLDHRLRPLDHGGARTGRGAHGLRPRQPRLRGRSPRGDVPHRSACTAASSSSACTPRAPSSRSTTPCRASPRGGRRGAATVGVVLSGSLIGLSADELDALAPDELDERASRGRLHAPRSGRGPRHSTPSPTCRRCSSGSRAETAEKRLKGDSAQRDAPSVRTPKRASENGSRSTNAGAPSDDPLGDGAPIPAECLNPCPEQQATTSTPGRRGWASMTKPWSGVSV